MTTTTFLRSLFVNGTRVPEEKGALVVNGIEIDKVIANGEVVWELIAAPPPPPPGYEALWSTFSFVPSAFDYFEEGFDTDGSDIMAFVDDNLGSPITANLDGTFTEGVSTATSFEEEFDERITYTVLIEGFGDNRLFFKTTYRFQDFFDPNDPYDETFEYQAMLEFDIETGFSFASGSTEEESPVLIEDRGGYNEISYRNEWLSIVGNRVSLK